MRPAEYSKELPVTPLPYAIDGAVRFDNQARFHPRKYLLALSERIAGDGSAIFENTRVTKIDEGEPCIITTAQGELRAKDVVVATHFPILNEGFYFARQVPTRSYALAIFIEGPVPEGMYINIEKPLFSVRAQPADGGMMLIITGEERQTGQDNDAAGRYREVAGMARGHFPATSVNYYWSAQDNQTIDRVPYIGKYTRQSKHLYVATGFGGWGMTNGTVSGMLLSDMILGKGNPWSEVFDPSRTEQIKSAAELLKANASVVKNLIAGYLPKGKSSDIPQMKNEEAKVVDWDGGKVAVYKDQNGTVHAVSEACTHMGCTLNWNSAEKSWDCPCHGSRFDPDGNVLQTPATSPLARKG